MRSTLLRVQARLSALLVSLTVAAPAATAVLSRRAGAANSDAAIAKGAIVGTGGLLMGLKACATSADDVARAGLMGGRAMTSGGRAAGSGLAHTGGVVDDVARTGGAVLDDASRFHPPAVAFEDGGRAALAVEEGAGGARSAGRTSPAPTRAGRPSGEPTALDVAEHVVDAVDLATDLADAAGKRQDAVREQEPGQPGLVTARMGDGSDRPAPQRPSAPWHGRWTDGAVVLQLAPGPGNAGTPAGRGLSGTLTQEGKAWSLVGKVDARGELDAWCVERRFSSIHVWGALGTDGSLEVRWSTRSARLRRAR